MAVHASTIGNQVWDTVDGDLVVAGSVLYPILYTDTQVTIVVGHTDCGAIKAAYSAVVDNTEPVSPGIKKRIALLKPVIEEGLANKRVTSSPQRDVIDRLVEYNVDRQIDFLQHNSEIPADELLSGFVYDFHGRYGSSPGRAYLTNVNGQTNVESIREMLPIEYRDHVHRLVE